MTEAFPLSPSAERALRILESHGHEAYVVGGCVRDFCMNKPPHDFDITSAAKPHEVKTIFRDFHVIPTGEKHGTVTVILDGEPLEITTFRKDGDYLDGRHPENVQFTSAIEEDLKRRDFTVNAMAYSPLRGLCDPFHGQEDLKKGVLRCVGDAQTRFTEDALRLLRALRFAARLEFDIEPETADALHALCPTIQKVSRERVLSEMNGLLQARGLVPVMRMFRDVVTAAVPETAQIAPEAYDQALLHTSRAPLDLSVRWAALLCPLGDQATAALKNLKASNQLTKEVSQLLSCGDLATDTGTVKLLMHRIGPDMCKKLFALRWAQGLIEDQDALLSRMQQILDDGECYQLSMLAVSGTDLMRLGITGKNVGKMLQHLLEQVLEGALPNEKEALLRAAGSF
ncbi:MAG: CCA tRNA nucleotidyltransferase [Clostridiales bacterium]|nr:CCA tRNA nucleotidyltransferase [Clostridiales bacterium]